jgi:hypothetical protein
MIEKYGYNWYAIESLHIEGLDNITDAESLGFECMRALIDEDVILNRDFWKSLKTFYAMCITANRNAQRYLSNMAKTTPRFAAEIFNIWPGISWEFIYQWPFKTIMEVLSRRINKLVENYQDDIEIIYCVTSAYKYEVEVWKSLVELRNFYNEYFLPNTLTGGWLIILSHKVFAENSRKDALENIQEKFFTSPIHFERWRVYNIKNELQEEALSHGRAYEEELKLRGQAAIYEAFGSVWASLLELKKKPSSLRTAVSDSMMTDIKGEKYRRENKGDPTSNEDIDKIETDFKKTHRNWGEDLLLDNIDFKIIFGNLSPKQKQVFKSVFLDNKEKLSDTERQAKSRLRKEFPDD